jgi:hypothetical protein
MFKGATGKRLFYFLSALLRSVSFVGLLIAYIIVKIVVESSITWLNTLLLTLSITCLVTSLFNLILCGFPATAYHEKKIIQFLCFFTMIFTGGILSTTLTGIASFIKVENEEIKNEKVFNIKTLHNKDGQINEKTKK